MVRRNLRCASPGGIFTAVFRRSPSLACSLDDDDDDDDADEIVNICDCRLLDNNVFLALAAWRL